MVTIAKLNFYSNCEFCRTLNQQTLHLSHLDSLNSLGLDRGHHIGDAVGVCGVTIGVGVRDSIGDRDMGRGSGDSNFGDGRDSNLGGRGLHSLDIPEGVHESLLSLCNVHGVSKVGIGNLRSLNITVDRSQVDVLSSSNHLVDIGKDSIGDLELGIVLEGEGSHSREADDKSLKSTWI